MVTIDSQVHAYERNYPGRPWAGFLHGPPQVTGDDMVAAMDAVGVDGALLISPYAMYRFDGSYALEVVRQDDNRVELKATIEAKTEWTRNSPDENIIRFHFIREGARRVIDDVRSANDDPVKGLKGHLIFHATGKWPPRSITRTGETAAGATPHTERCAAPR